MFENFSYEERGRSINTVVTKHKDSTTYEDFISRVYSPVASSSTFCSVILNDSGSGDASSCPDSQTTLAAALLDSNGHSHKVVQRDQKYRG